ncbi:MAG: lysophospholipid acyltransferase family protein [Pseudolabrys sp.]|nr:lysophospholipid acyltransferase family protein [Pseudolabrys sp.]MBV9954860.1 lysophospholipid acyltransferase family protein [Pseudolabrys sp.]
MSSIKRMLGSPAAQGAIGAALAGYLKFVHATSREIFDPPDIYGTVEAEMPVILTVWHGQHFMMPFVRRQHRAKVMISRHRDGAINAIVAERLGIEAIRGSGAAGGDFHRKGGVSAFNAMLAALREGYNVAMTADIPKVSRVAGMGIVKLAQFSGRPIYPLGIATQRRIELDNWDSSAINLPFGRLVFASTGPIRVPPDADDATLEAARQRVEHGINQSSERAYSIADGRAPRG